MEVRLWPSLQFKGHKEENLCLFSLSEALFLFIEVHFMEGFVPTPWWREWLCLIINAYGVGVVWVQLLGGEGEHAHVILVLRECI